MRGNSTTQQRNQTSTALINSAKEHTLSVTHLKQLQIEMSNMLRRLYKPGIIKPNYLAGSRDGESGQGNAGVGGVQRGWNGSSDG